MDYIINEEIFDWINNNRLPSNKPETENNFTHDDIGDWDGEEELASKNLSRIMHTIELTLKDLARPDILSNFKTQVWNDWSKDTRILEVNETVILDYTNQLIASNSQIL